jgi:HSP20 family protein
MKQIRTNGHLSPAIASLLNDFFADGWTGFQSAGTPTASGGFPPTNIRETAEDFRIEMAAPGLRRDLFKVEFNDDLLTVSYKAEPADTENKSEAFVLREFIYPGFERSFMLPKQKVEGQKIEARYTDGILVINVPKKEEMKKAAPRQITIS